MKKDVESVLGGDKYYCDDEHHNNRYNLHAYCTRGVAAQHNAMLLGIQNTE